MTNVGGNASDYGNTKYFYVAVLFPDAERAKRAERQDLQIRAIRLYYNNGKGISLVRGFWR